MSDWISVDERLPRYGREVLVSTPAGVVQHVAYYLDASDIELEASDVEDAAWWEACTDDSLTLSVNAFSHWMPLPDPPEDV